MDFSKIWKKFRFANKILDENQHFVRLCRWDSEKKELEYKSFDLRNRDIEVANKKGEPPCVSGQWLEYWKGDFAKAKEAICQHITPNEKSKFCCLKVGSIKDIGTRYDMDLSVEHTGMGHAGIFNIQRNNHKFLRDMILEAMKNIRDK